MVRTQGCKRKNPCLRSAAQHRIVQQFRVIYVPDWKLYPDSLNILTRMPNCFKVSRPQGTPPISPARESLVRSNLYTSVQFIQLLRLKMHHGHLCSRPHLIPRFSKLDLPTLKPWPYAPTIIIQTQDVTAQAWTSAAFSPKIFQFPAPAPQVRSRSNRRDAWRVSVRSCHFSAQNTPQTPSITRDLLPTTSLM